MVSETNCVLCRVRPPITGTELCEECSTIRTVAADDNVYNWGTNVDPGDEILVTIDGKIHKARCTGWRTRNDKRVVRTDIMQVTGFYDAPFSDVRIIRNVREILQASELASLHRQIAVLKHDRRMLCDVEFNVIMNNIRATRPKGSE